MLSSLLFRQEDFKNFGNEARGFVEHLTLKVIFLSIDYDCLVGIITIA